MAAPNTPILDSFKRANNASLGSNWTTFTGFNAPRIIEESAGSVASGEFSGAVYNVQKFGPNCEAYWTIKTFEAAKEINFSIRDGANTNDENAYNVAIFSEETTLRKTIAGVHTTLATATKPWKSGDGIWIKTVGNFINLYRRTEGNWELLAEKEDTKFPNAGYLSFYIEGVGFRLTEFGGGTIPEPAPLLSIPPTFKSPRKLWKPFPFAAEAVKGPIALPSTTLSFKVEISAPLKVSQKLSTTILSKFESSGKIIVGYKLSSTIIESKFSVSAPLKVEYKLGSTTLESKFSILAPLKIQYKLPKTTTESKFSLSSTLKVSQKLSSTLESKFSLAAPIRTAVKLSSIIESKLFISAPLKTKFNLGKLILENEFSLSGQLLVIHKQEVPNLPERIARPKIIIPGPAVKWNWWLCRSSDLGQITELSSAHSKHLQLMLNQPGMASFWMHLEDKKTEYIEELKTCIVCYRNGKAIWSGPIFKCVENADNTSNATLQVTALGWFELLNHRIVHTGKEWEEILSKSGASYTPVATESALQLYYGKTIEPFGIPRNEIAVDLINRANIDVPTGITIGLNPEVSSLNYTVPQFHPVGELITQLTSIENSFDFKIDPLSRKFNIYYNQIKQNSTMYGLGQDRGPGVRFTYPGNCIVANRSADGTKTQNRTEAQGPYGVGKGESLLSISENGLFEKSESLTDVTNIDILIAYANIQVATLEQPFKILTFNPRPVNDSESYAVPRPFEDYDIGDIVYANVKKGPRFVVGYPNPQPVRIFGLNLDIDDNGLERVSQIQTVYST